ncbi:hypothetical protein PIB30_021129 [Stylosanthes scabra]|uniref:Uncharacterized protein n=1 Tax=Stylosanthes scabra TaxID=79078 RepID=A0ABU6Q8N8_9FABA|nr:hypothetical protein [Stylosanthes scabra]
MVVSDGNNDVELTDDFGIGKYGKAVGEYVVIKYGAQFAPRQDNNRCKDLHQNEMLSRLEIERKTCEQAQRFISTAAMKNS